MTQQLDYEAAIYTPHGWLSLDNELAGYESEKESTAERSVTYRQRTVAGDWVEGTFVTASVRDNVTETLSVWVFGNTPGELMTRLQVLTDALEQLAYQVKIRWGDQVETWTCMPASYSVSTTSEMRFATTALVKAQVPRLPTTKRERTGAGHGDLAISWTGMGSSSDAFQLYWSAAAAPGAIYSVRVYRLTGGQRAELLLDTATDQTMRSFANADLSPPGEVEVSVQAAVGARFGEPITYRVYVNAPPPPEPAFPAVPDWRVAVPAAHDPAYADLAWSWGADPERWRVTAHDVTPGYRVRQLSEWNPSAYLRSTSVFRNWAHDVGVDRVEWEIEAHSGGEVVARSVVTTDDPAPPAQPETITVVQ